VNALTFHILEIKSI